MTEGGTGGQRLQLAMVSLLAVACLIPTAVTAWAAIGTFPSDTGIMFAAIELIVSVVGGALAMVAIRMMRDLGEARK